MYSLMKFDCISPVRTQALEYCSVHTYICTYVYSVPTYIHTVHTYILYICTYVYSVPTYIHTVHMYILYICTYILYICTSYDCGSDYAVSTNMLVDWYEIETDTKIPF